MPRKQKQITPDELWFVWTVINELQAYLNCQIEAGAEGANKDSDNATKAKKIINKERRRLLGIVKQ